ncbi:MAG: hypothetical protein JW873_02345 [Candidatus Saganbacteria bacterium]|nr:hypothetical protein [Candidatus Saganbacteria bacterium]
MPPRALLVGCLLVVFCAPLLADEPSITVEVKAESLKYHESGLLEAAGSVEVELKGLTIRSDRLLMDPATNIATAEGHVMVAGRDGNAAASELIYDADKESSRFAGYRARLVPGGEFKGPLFLEARSVEAQENKLSGRAAEMTTCGRPASHYVLLADRFSYFPDDHMEAHNLTLVVGELPVCWLPYYYYDLHDQRQRNWTFGRNDVEGNYLKTAWSYSPGTLLLDFMEKKGTGYGTATNYTLGALGLGSLYLYHLDERDTGLSDWVARISQEKKLDQETTLKLDSGYASIYQLPGGRLDQTTFGLGLNHSGAASWGGKFDLLDDRAAAYGRYTMQLNYSAGRLAANYSNNYEFARNDPRWLRDAQRIGLNAGLTSSVNFSAAADYYHSSPAAGDPGREKVEPVIELTGREPNYSWRCTENWFIDLRQGLYPGLASYEYVERQPEIELTPQALDLKLFTLQPVLGYGYYREVKNVPALGGSGYRVFSAQRTRATLNASRSINVGLGSVLLLGAGLDQFLYSPGDQLYALRESAGLQTDLNSCFRNELAVRQAYTDGNTPFFFDRLGTVYHDITEKATLYHQNKFSWSVNGGHNWQTNKYYDVMTDLKLAPDPRWQLNLTTGWDLENRLYKNLVTGVRCAPNGAYAADLSLNQDLNGAGLQTASVLHDLYLLQGEDNELHFRFSQVFDAATKEFKVRDIMLVKQLHCWELTFSYSDYTRDFSFVFSLKALPGQPAGFSSGRGFYFQGFDQGLQQLNSGDIRRY